MLSKNDKDHAGFDDVRAAGIAVATVAADGLKPWLGSSLTSRFIKDPAPYQDIVGRGLDELQRFLKAACVK